MFFPAFSVIFGGSQLASAVILQQPNKSVLVVILGLAVQVAPLAIAPLVMKLSGGVLNRFAGIINNPKKGLIDRTRNWAQEQSKHLANSRSLGLDDDKLKKRHFLRRAGRSINHWQQRRKQNIEDYQKKANTAYLNSRHGKKQSLFSSQVGAEADLATKQAERRWAEMMGGEMPKDLDRSLGERGMRALSSRYATRKDLQAQQMVKRAQGLNESAAIEGLRTQMAGRVASENLTSALIQDKEKLGEAAGIYQHGEDAALASAINAANSEKAKSTEEAKAILQHYNMSSAERQAHAKGIFFNKDGRDFAPDDVHTRKAAIKEQFAVGTSKEVFELVAMSGTPEMADYNEVIAEALVSSGVKDKAPFIHGKVIDDIPQGVFNGPADLNASIASWVDGKKFSARALSTTDADGVEILTKAISANRGSISNEALSELHGSIREALEDDILKGNVASNAKKAYERLVGTLPPPPP